MTSYQAIPLAFPPKKEHEQKLSLPEKSLSFGMLSGLLVSGILLGFVLGYNISIEKPVTGNDLHLPAEEREELALIPDEEQYDLSMTTSPPNNLLYLNSKGAFERLTNPSTLNSHYFFYESGLEAQINQMYCAVATSAAVLNSLRYHIDFVIPMDHIYYPYPFATQRDILFPDTCVNENVIRSSSEGSGVTVSPGGLSLAQVTKLLHCHLNRKSGESNQVTSDNIWTVYHRSVDPNLWTIDLMRSEMIQILNSTDSRVAINYHRKELGQVGGGHFSPIGAYNPETDSFLILDVAKYKYPPVWASAKYLFDSMATYDSCGIWNFPEAQDLLIGSNVKDSSQKMQILGCKPTYRGYVVVKKNE